MGVCLLIGACALIAIASAGAHADAPGRPEFRQRLSDAEYQQQLKALFADRPALTALEKSKLPTFGEHVVGVKPGSRAQRIGIQVGDVVTHTDDFRHITRVEDTAPRNRARTLRWTTSDGEKREARVPPGKTGFSYVDYQRLDLWYVRHGQRSPAYEDALVAAVQARRSHPDLAETALWRAVRAGYSPDEFSDVLGAEIAFYQGRPGVAAQFAMRVPPRDREHPYRLQDRIDARIALARGRLDEALHHARRVPDPIVKPAGLPALLERWRREGKTAPPDPATFGDELERVPMRKHQLSEINDEYLSAFHADLDTLLVEQQFTMHTRPNYRDQNYFGVLEPTDAIELLATVTVEAGPRRGRYARCLEIRLLDWQYRQRHDLDGPDFDGYELLQRQTMLGVQLERDDKGNTLISITGGHQPKKAITYSEPLISLKPDEPTPVRVRLVRIGPWGMVELNGMPIATVPVEDDVRYPAVWLQNVGAKSQFTRLVVNELRQAKTNSE